MTPATSAKEHVGHRINVAGHTGILQGLPPNGVLMWDEWAGKVITVSAPHTEIEDARFTCERCARLCNRLFDHPDRPGTVWCAECSRPFAQSHQAKPTCQQCGAIGGAVRNPRRGVPDQRILCRSCHAAAGSVVIVPGAFVRESDPLPGGQGRAVCAAANIPGTHPCEGAVKPRRPTGENLCNAHAGTQRLGERR